MKCRCGETDPEKFAGDRTSATGKQSTCKKCQAQRAKERRKKYAQATPSPGFATFLESLPRSDMNLSEDDVAQMAREIVEQDDDPEPRNSDNCMCKRCLPYREARFPKPLATMYNMGQDEVLTDADILAEQSAYGGQNKLWGEMHSPALKKVLFIPDCHIPYEDKRAWKLMLRVAQKWKPDTIVILGDFLDMFSVSSHDKRPDRVRLLDEEVAAAHDRLTELDSLGANEKYFVAGNHEDRLERYLIQKAPELFNMVKVRDLLKLDERGWKYTPYKQSVRIGKLTVTHDAGSAGGTAHTKALSAFEHCVAIGHTHRMAVTYEGNARGESKVGMMFGWLGDVNEIDYLHRITALRSWQLGFGVGYMDENGVVHVQAIPMVSYRVVLDGVLYVG